ncbi:hypothetical protein IT408_02660 [Candidatus Uhrbacteria bacterium]|nr:hypothetical protein [Candidatus Uhrbacteria bacterium]
MAKKKQNLKGSGTSIDFLVKTTRAERGSMSENRFFSISKSWEDKPDWFLRVVQSSVEEDHHDGIDAWVETTDAGRIPIQIKSSDKARVVFEQGTVLRGRLPVNRPLVVVVRPDSSDEHIRRCILIGTGYLRHLRLINGCKQSA